MLTWLKVWWFSKQLNSNRSIYVAANALAKLGGPRAVQHLINALENGKDNVPDAARRALSDKLHDPRAVEPLIKALRHHDVNIRAVAADALGNHDGPRSVEPLIKALEDNSERVRISAARALGELHDPRAVEPLIKALARKDECVRQHAADSLGKLGDRRAIEPLINALGDDGDPVICAADALLKLGDPRAAVQPLIKALGHDWGSVRQRAAGVLRRLGETKWEPLIKDDLGDFGRLGGSGDLRAVEPLVKALESRNEDVRGNAAMALGALGEPRAIDPLIKAMAREGTSYFAAGALVALSDPRAVDLLIRAFERGNEYVCNAAADALVTLGGPRALDPLIKALENGDENVRQAAQYGLKKLGDPRALQPLIKALLAGLAGSTDVRCTAEALGELGDPRAVEPLIKALAHDRSGVRVAAADALARLGEVRWKTLVRGDIGDFGRLRTSGDPRAVAPEIMAMPTAGHTTHDLQPLGALAEVPPEVINAITKLSHPDPDTRYRAAEDLRDLRHPHALPALIRAMQDPSAGDMLLFLGTPDPELRIRYRAAEALGELGGTEAVTALIDALATDDRQYRLIVVEALEKIGDARGLKAAASAFMGRTRFDAESPGFRKVQHRFSDPPRSFLHRTMYRRGLRMLSDPTAKSLSTAEHIGYWWCVGHLGLLAGAPYQDCLAHFEQGIKLSPPQDHSIILDHHLLKCALAILAKDYRSATALRQQVVDRRPPFHTYDLEYARNLRVLVREGLMPDEVLEFQPNLGRG